MRIAFSDCLFYHAHLAQSDKGVIADKSQICCTWIEVLNEAVARLHIIIIVMEEPDVEGFHNLLKIDRQLGVKRICL